MAIKLPAPLVPQKLTLATVPADEDELIEAIQNDPLGAGDDNTWDLHEDVDATQIERFLSDALNDMDPAERKALEAEASD